MRMMSLQFWKNLSIIMPKVTVAIPTYNRKEYLREVINSVLAQTFQDFSIIVFDNRSDYDVRAFVDEFNDARISVIISDTNDGTYNRIFIHRFDAPYVVIFHDDDVMHPELLAREVAALDAHPELTWVGTGLRFVHDGARMHDFTTGKSKKVFIYDAAGVTRLILRGFNLCYGSVMYRSEHLTEMQTRELYSKWGDRPYLISLLQRGKAGILKEQLVNYRIHPGQDSQSSAQDTVQYAINLLLFYKDALHGLRTASDRRLFYSHIANTVIPAAIVSSRSIGEFNRFLEPYRKHGLLHMHYLTARGMFRLLRIAMRRMR